MKLEINILSRIRYYKNNADEETEKIYNLMAEYYRYNFIQGYTFLHDGAEKMETQLNYKILLYHYYKLITSKMNKMITIITENR